MEKLRLDLNIKNQTQEKADWRKLIQKSLAKHYQKGHFVIDLLICGPTRARSLNQQYRGQNYVPDILTFKLANFPDNILPVVPLGQVVICPAQIKKLASEQKIIFGDYLARALNHAIANLTRNSPLRYDKNRRQNA